LQIFSLPAEERKQYFDLSKFKGRYFFIPNFPSVSLFSRMQNSAPVDEVRIIYQGRICAGRGIEEMIALLPLSLQGKKLTLTLRGRMDPDFEETLERLLSRDNVREEVSIHPPTAYAQLPEFTASAHIGLAIFTGIDLMNSTLGTSSNKVFEYSACGLPFLYYDNLHFRHHYRHMPWGIPTDLTCERIIGALNLIVREFDELSASARENFLQQRNFEKVVAPAVGYVKAQLRA
jgi:hypothetical protein